MPNQHVAQWLCLLALTSGVAARADVATLGPLTVADFVRPAEYEAVQLSPSGKYLAVAMRRDGVKLVTVLFTQTLAVASVVKFNPPNEAHQIHWANDERLLVSIASVPSIVDFPAATGELYGVNADGSQGRIVFGARAGDERPERLSRVHDFRGLHRITSLLPDDPDHVLISTYARSKRGDYITNAALLNVYTGQLRVVSRAPLKDAFLLADHAGVVRFAIGRNKALETVLFYRATGKASWQRVSSFSYGTGALVPVAFADESDNVFVLDNRGTSTRGLYSLDLATGSLTEVFRDPRVDIEAALVAPHDGVAYAVRYVPGHVAYHILPNAQPYAGMMHAAQQKFPNAAINLTSLTRDRSKAVVEVTGAREPGTFYLYDARSNDFAYLLRTRRWLDPARMADVRAVDITARDGQWLQGFLTEPRSAPRPGPLVVMPHGGPHGTKDGPLFDATAQLLAYHGYTVLTVNYRGSQGYGAAFNAAGFGQWGGIIAHDITDAVRWAIAAGVADPRRVAIFGTSFGAYAAMKNAIDEPALYRCAIGVSGVYDLPLLFETGDVARLPYGVTYLRTVVGDDAAQLSAISIVQNAARLTIPVLLAHGTLDTQTPVAHARRLRDALTARDAHLVYIEEPREAHDFIEPGHRARLLDAILLFLGETMDTGAP